jgi:hypothetical protein
MSIAPAIIGLAERATYRHDRSAPDQCMCPATRWPASHSAIASAIWAEKGCAPLVLEGAALARAKYLFLRRAARLGHRRTRDPDLRILAGSRALPAELTGAHWQVILPFGVTEVRLQSRIWVPAHMRADETDTRALGVAIARLTFDGREVALDSPALATGWHPPEAGWRWTDGSAIIPIWGSRMISFDLAIVGEYWLASSHRATHQVEAYRCP